MEGVGLIRKEDKNIIHWLGSGFESSADSESQISGIKQELGEVEAYERQLGIVIHSFMILFVCRLRSRAGRRPFKLTEGRRIILSKSEFKSNLLFSL